MSQQPPPEQPQPPQDQPGYNQQAPQPPGGATNGFVPTIGLVVATIGAVFVLLSVLGLDYMELSQGPISEAASLSEVNDYVDVDSDGLVDLYVGFGAIFALLAIAVSAAACALTNLDKLPRAATAVAVLCLGLHINPLFLWTIEDPFGGTVDVSPAIGGWLGMLGYVALAAGPWLKMPLTGQKN